MPSNSKCVSCTYESEDENDVKPHMKSKHMQSGDSCSFEADNCTSLLENLLNVVT